MHDFIVIGGGLIGMLTARELRLADARVAVLERGHTGKEASWAGGGILSPLYPWRYPDAVTALASWSQSRYADFCNALVAESGIDPEWTQSGLLMLGEQDNKAAMAWARKKDKKLEVVANQVLPKLEPGLSSIFTSALLLPDIAQVRNPRLLRALEASIKSMGVTVEENIGVQDITVEAGHVTGVRTTCGQRSAGNVVIAGGAWSGMLAKSFGVSLDVEPVRGQMILFRGRPGLVSHIILHDGRYLIPRRDGRVLAGSTLEYVGYDKATTDDARRDLYDFAVSLIPDLAACEIENHWAGLRPGSPQSIPYIGVVPGTKGVFVNAGHFRNGVTTGPASARLLSDIALSRQPILSPAPYSLKAHESSIKAG